MADSDNKNGGISVSWKQLGVMLSVVAALAVAHGAWVMPQILQQVAPVIEKEIAQYHNNHIKHVHPGAATVKDVDLHLKPIMMRLDSIDSRLEKMERRQP